jgi:hypothetical protein
VTVQALAPLPRPIGPTRLGPARPSSAGPSSSLIVSTHPPGRLAGVGPVWPADEGHTCKRYESSVKSSVAARSGRSGRSARTR